MPPKIQAVASIDLHGKRKDQAIASVTQFLHDVVRNFPPNHCGKLWVCIITGSGHHSPQGPVLREAVRSLLDKREMEYCMQKGKGSFMVNACSGHELTAGPAQAQDSKLVVKPSSHQREDVRLINRPRNANRFNTTTSSSSRSRSPMTASPKPAEVAADDALVERVKVQSQHEQRQAQRHEHVQFKQALSESKRALEWEMEQDARRHEDEIAAALLQSQQEEERLQRQEEERLEEILRHSREEEERIKREEEERLAAVLRESQEEEEMQRRQEELELERALSISQDQVSQDDVVLNEALEQSMQEVQLVDSDLNNALSLSLRESHRPREDVLIEKTVGLSIGNASMVDYEIPEVN